MAEIIKCYVCDWVGFESSSTCHCPQCGRNDGILILTGWEEYSQKDKEQLFECLNTLKVNFENKIQEEFLCFPSGTDREVIRKYLTDK